MVLAMPTVLRNFAEEYAAATGGKGDEYKLRSIIAEKRLGGLLVAPKDIVRVVENAALLLAGALNAAYGEKTARRHFRRFESASAFVSVQISHRIVFVPSKADL